MQLGTTVADLLAMQAGQNGHSNGSDKAAAFGPQLIPNGPTDRPGELVYLKIRNLVLDKRLQQRSELYDFDWINDRLRPALRNLDHGEADKVDQVRTLAPIEVWDVDGTLYVVDGFQRVEAHRLDGYTFIEGYLYHGTFREAQARSFQVNQHGKPLTDRDLGHKLRAALEFYQEDLFSGGMSLSEFCKLTNLNIATVSKSLVLMGIELPGEVMVTRTRTNKDGSTSTSTYSMKTKGIGRPKKEKGEDLGDGETADFAEGDVDEVIRANKPARATSRTEVIQGYTQDNFGSAGLDLGDEEDDVDDVDDGDGDVGTVPVHRRTAVVSGRAVAGGNGDTQVINVPVWAIEELRDVVLNYGSVQLQEALQGSLL